MSRQMDAGVSPSHPEGMFDQRGPGRVDYFGSSVAHQEPRSHTPIQEGRQVFYTYQPIICRDLDCYVVKSRNCSALATFPLSMVVQSSLRRSDGTSCHGTSTIPAS